MRFKVRLGVLVLFLAGCGSSYTLDFLSDYEPGQDYSKYKTFNFYKESGRGVHGNTNELDARLRPAVEAELVSAGMTKANKPDFWVTYWIDVKDRENLDPVNTYVSVVGKEEFKSGALVLDFIDATTNQRYWRGLVMGDIAERTPDDRLETAVRRILENYPPED